MVIILVTIKTIHFWADFQIKYFESVNIKE